MSEVKFVLGQNVKISASGESGVVIGVAEYSTTTLRSILLRYKSADGRAVEQWWTEDALEAV